MALPRLQIKLLVDTEAHAITVRDELVSQAASRPRVGNRFEGASLERDPGGRGWVVRLDVRYFARGDRDAVRDWLVGQAQDHPVVRTWVLGILATEHLCTHDEERPGPCSDSEFRLVLRRGEDVET